MATETITGLYDTYDDAVKTVREIEAAGVPERNISMVANKGDFAVLCGAEQEEVLKAILESSKSVADTLAPLAPWLAEQQIALVVTSVAPGWYWIRS